MFPRKNFNPVKFKYFTLRFIKNMYHIYGLLNLSQCDTFNYNLNQILHKSLF
jgi:hypothetical protein